MVGPSGFHVLTRDGDGTREVEAAIARHGSAERAGLHRYFYVSRANQTVVMTLNQASPLAITLREQNGWSEPRE